MKKFLLSVGVVAAALSANATDYFVMGAFDGWQTGTCTEADKMTEVETGVYEFTFPGDLSGEFLFVPGTVGSAPDWDNKVLPNSISNILVPDEEYYATYRNGGADGKNFAVEGSVANAKVRLDVTDADEAIVLLTGATQANEYTDIYMVGGFNGQNWDENRTDCKLTGNADANEFTGTFTLTGQDEGAVAAYVKFKAGVELYGGVMEDSENVDITGPTNTAMTLKKGGQTFALAFGTYTITIKLPYNGEEGTITFSEPTALNTVEADANVAPVYYNLQGVRVDNAANGLYIVVRGDKAAKEFVR